MKFINAFKLFYKKHFEKEKLNLLSPIVLNKEDGINNYIKTLKNAIKDKGARNIAISGSYGSGKSSVIKTYINENDKHRKKSLVRWNEIPIKYGNILSGITIKLDYLYGMVNSNYKLDEYKLFKERINGINNSVLKEFKHYADLNLKGTNINTKFSKIQYLIDSEQKNKNFDEVFDEIKDLIEEEGMLISSICFTIRDNKEDLYKLALNCINERAENINL